MKRLSIAIVAILCLIFAVPAEASTYKLTIRFELELYMAFAQMTADQFVEDLDSGEQTCSSLMMVASMRGYDPDNLDPLVMGQNFKIKNESGKIISSGKFKPQYSRPGGNGGVVCRVQATISMPKAKFYDVVDSDGNVLVSGFPFSKFKKNVATINIWDWN